MLLMKIILQIYCYIIFILIYKQNILNTLQVSIPVMIFYKVWKIIDIKIYIYLINSFIDKFIYYVIYMFCNVYKLNKYHTYDLVPVEVQICCILRYGYIVCYRLYIVL